AGRRRLAEDDTLFRPSRRDRERGDQQEMGEQHRNLLASRMTIHSGTLQSTPITGSNQQSRGMFSIASDQTRCHSLRAVLRPTPGGGASAWLPAARALPSRAFIPPAQLCVERASAGRTKPPGFAGACYRI